MRFLPTMMAAAMMLAGTPAQAVVDSAEDSGFLLSSSIEVAASPADASFSLDTPIAALIADYRAKAVLDRNLPGLSADENLDKFKAMSLRQFAPLTGGQLTAELMTKTAYDLAAITAGQATPAPARRKTIGR